MSSVPGVISAWKIHYCEHHDEDCVEGIVSVFLHDSNVQVHVCPYHYSVYGVN